MNAILLVAMTLGQCGGSYYTTPTYYYSSPVVVCQEPVIRFDIRYDGKIYSKFYAPIRLPNGNQIQVPVVNGMLPRIKTVYSRGYEYRICTYDTNRYYKGGVPQYICADSAKASVVQPPTPVRETRPEDITNLPEPIETVEEEAPKVQALPRKDTKQSTELESSAQNLRLVPVNPVAATIPVKATEKPVVNFDPYKRPYEFTSSDEPAFTKNFPNY